MSARILVIDDEAAIRETMRMILEYEGHDVVLAGSGQEGLQAACVQPLGVAVRGIGKAVHDRPGAQAQIVVPTPPVAGRRVPASPRSRCVTCRAPAAAANGERIATPSVCVRSARGTCVAEGPGNTHLEETRCGLARC